MFFSEIQCLFEQNNLGCNHREAAGSKRDLASSVLSGEMTSRYSCPEAVLRTMVWGSPHEASMNRSTRDLVVFLLAAFSWDGMTEAFFMPAASDIH